MTGWKFNASLGDTDPPALGGGGSVLVLFFSFLCAEEVSVGLYSWERMGGRTFNGGEGSLEPPDMTDIGPLPDEPIEFGDTLGPIPGTFPETILDGAVGLGLKIFPYV